MAGESRLEQLQRKHRPELYPTTDRLIAELTSRRVILDASGSGTLDLRGVSLLALTNRRGAEVVPLLTQILRQDPSGVMKDYAMSFLAAAGDDTAVVDALRRLRWVLRRPSRDVEARVTVLAYVGQHLGSGQELTNEVVSLVRTHWQSMTEPFERSWIARFWPDLAPGGPSPDRVRSPDPATLRRWARSSMMLGQRGVTTLPVSDGEPSRRRPDTVVPLLDHRWLPEPLHGSGPQQRPTSRSVRAGAVYAPRLPCNQPTVGLRSSNGPLASRQGPAALALRMT